MSLTSEKLGRRDFVTRLGVASLAVAGAGLSSSCTVGSRIGPVLENDNLRVVFDGSTGLLAAIQNKLTQEEMAVHGQGFAVIASEFKLTPQNCRLESLEKKSQSLVQASYRRDGRTVVTSYTLGPKDHFFEARLSVTSPGPYRLRTLVVNKLSLSGAPLKYFRYPYQKNVVYFGRSAKGGIFLGLELPFDASSLDESHTVHLAYHPSVKVGANERIDSEAMFFGVYQRSSLDLYDSDQPLASESDAMVRMTSELLGPPRHGLVPMACGWWCEMEHQAFQTDVQVMADMRSIDFLAECGVDWVTDSHPWSGEIDKMNMLGQHDRYAPGPLVVKLLEYARQKNVKIVFWPTMNNTDPWWAEKGRPFRQDRPDWLMFPPGHEKRFGYTFATGYFITESENGNCLANQPFFDWLMGLEMDAMRTNYFPGWVMDGDFFGGGGVVLPVNCQSDQHDHLPGDSNYACERSLVRMMRRVRQAFPNCFMGPMCRPAMDLGVWSNRDADSVFTLDEFARPEPLPGLSGQPLNVIMGDKARSWSRVRVHRDFFPHYMDQPLVFAAPKSMHGPEWTSEKIDYVMLSVLSSSPNQLFYLPTKAGIPARDKAEIRKWLDWGRNNIPYLRVRKDLPDLPGIGMVDGSAHIISDHGLIFLFNPNAKPVTGRFRLDMDSIGLTSGTRFEIKQVYPASATIAQRKYGDEVAWAVPSYSASVISIASA